MKNIEKFSKEISNLVNEDNILPCAIATVAGIRKEKPCYHQECEECHKKCLKWMYSEYNEPILTDQEKQALKHICEAMESLGKKVTTIKKYKVIANQIEFYLNEPNNHISLCTEDSLFSGMQNGNEYTPGELGL